MEIKIEKNKIKGTCWKTSRCSEYEESVATSHGSVWFYVCMGLTSIGFRKYIGGYCFPYSIG